MAKKLSSSCTVAVPNRSPSVTFSSNIGSKAIPTSVSSGVDCWIVSSILSACEGGRGCIRLSSSGACSVGTSGKEVVRLNCGDISCPMVLASKPQAGSTGAAINFSSEWILLGFSEVGEPLSFVRVNIGSFVNPSDGTTMFPARVLSDEAVMVS